MEESWYVAMKIGIVSCYFHHNYGSMLQAFATQEIVSKLGFENVTFRTLTPISYMTQPRSRYYIHKFANFDLVKIKIQQFKNTAIANKDEDFVKNNKFRSDCFENFWKENFNLTSLLQSRNELTREAQVCSAIIVGSDMLWHPKNVEHDLYTLTWVPDHIKKISYATSIGATKIPQYMIPQYVNFLNHFDAISVREKSAADIIENLVGKNKAKVTLDPTLLFTADEWMKIQCPEPFIKGNYILCYFLGRNLNHRKFAKRLREVTGYKIVALQHLDEYIPEDVGYADETPYNVGPSELVNLIRNAQYVCTDSFHGTCFSILNHKNFFVFNRYDSDNTESTNTRIDFLLALTGLSNRKVESLKTKNEIKKCIEMKINYCSVDKKLEKARQESILFLLNALNDS